MSLNCVTFRLMRIPDASHQSRAERRGRGAFFTPPLLVEFIVRWAVRTPDDRVFEPSCGDARFLRAAAARLGPMNGDVDDALVGIELHAGSVRTARTILTAEGVDARIAHGSFFEAEPDPAFAAVVGNPPYLRFQSFAGESRAAALSRALAAGVRLDGRSNAWAYFVVHAAQFVANGGRLGLVLPAELLHADYAADVRAFLLERFGDVRVVTFRRRIFADADVNVVVLLAEGQGGTDHFKTYEARDIADLRAATELQWRGSTLEPSAKWTSALLAPTGLDLYEQVVASGAFQPLHANWGKASIGAVTGAAGFFRLRAVDAKRLRLAATDTKQLFPGPTADLTYSEQAWEAAKRRGDGVLLFHPSGDPSPAGRRYIAEGERRGIDLSGKCAGRHPWWRVPLPSLADLFVANTSYLTCLLMTNRAGVRHTNAYYGVNLEPARRALGQDLLPLATLNSVSLLAAELTGRSHGKGALKMSVSEVDAWPVPAPKRVRTVEQDLRRIRRRVRTLVQRGQMLRAATLVDEVILADQDRAALAAVRRDLRELHDRRAQRRPPAVG